MEIHNRIEDEVSKLVDEIFDNEDKKKELGYCTCYQCRLDVSCYVLNRMAPEYVISGRGVAHGENDSPERRQKAADLITFVKTGWERIESTKRPHVMHSAKKGSLLPSAPVFNFPTIIGRIFNGSNFEPVAGTQVTLLREGNLVRMIDQKWENPCSLVSNTAGTFIFWPYPEQAKSPGETKLFSFELLCSVKGFEDCRHFFELKLSGENIVVDQFTEQRTFKIQDLYLFAK